MDTRHYFDKDKRGRILVELQTNAWAFLNLQNPLTAWAAYRGCLVPTPQGKGFISLWHAAKLLSKDYHFLHIENQLEDIRAKHFPDRISRLRGIFVFTDLISAERATKWNGDHFKAEQLVELSVSINTTKHPKMDANWITHSKSDNLPSDWMYLYWSGEQYPNCEPIWEVLTNDRTWVLDVEHRERAYKIIKKAIPNSLCLLEIARLSAWIGADLGNISYFCRQSGDHLIMFPIIDMSLANDDSFIQNIRDLIDSGHPVNNSDIKPFIETGQIHTPDLSRFRYQINLIP